MKSYQKILVAIDPLGEYDNIINRTKSVAGPKTEISLIHVHVPSIHLDARYADPEGELKMEEKAREIMAGIGKKLKVPSDRQYLEQGRPAQNIHRVVKEAGIDLVIMGTHGRHGVQLLLGSTANAVLHGTQCDVLAVKVGT